MATATETTRSPMLRTVALKTLRDQRRALAWWALGLIGVAFMYAGFYPSIRDNAVKLNEYIESFPEPLRRAFLGESGDFTSPAGYLNTELFSFMAPLLLLLYAIGSGARAIAGEEERQSLDLLLATPVRRRRVVVDKFGAMLAGAAGLSVVLWASVAGLGPPFDLTPGLWNLTAAVVSCYLLAVAFGAIALAIGCATGRRAQAIGVTGGLAAATYLFDVLAPSVQALEWLQMLSPFYYYRGAEPLVNGLHPAHALVLAAVAGAAFAVAIVTFERRDLAA
ncbi:MAG TPA: ABC transporter permease subunit [Actinomycetota bacterium]